MNETLLPLLFPLLFATMVAVVVMAARSSAKKSAQTLRLLGERLGLTVLEHAPTLGIFPRLPFVEGLRRGKHVRLYTFTTGSGKSRKTWAAVGVMPAVASPLRFSLAVQGLGTRIMEFFGVKEITFDDPAFDQAWFVRAQPAEFFRVALLPELRERLMAGRRAGLKGTFQCETGEIRYAEAGSFSTGGKLERYVLATDLCCDLAAVAEVAAT